MDVLQHAFANSYNRFFGLLGIYYSLQYLSLSDATVLTFLTPSATAVAGYFLLGERFARKDAAAGRKTLDPLYSESVVNFVFFVRVVLSLLGVILIARPQALFGASTPSEHAPSAREINIWRRLAEANVGEDGVTPSQRLIAVGYNR